MSRPTNSKIQAGDRQAGSTTIAALGFIVILSMLFGSILTRSMNTYRQVSNIASWQEALIAAEAGADTAMVELRKTLTNPATAFAGWSTTDEEGKPLPHNGRMLKIPRINHGGEGNTQMDAVVTIDAPTELLDRDRQWYRIRAVGTTYLPGTPAITGDKRDSSLRKLSFQRNSKTRLAVDRPQTSRMIELLVKPVSFEKPNVSDRPIIMNNHDIFVNSYDSRYPHLSTNGLYDPNKTAKNGDIATNSQLIEAGSATIHGDAFTNGGTIVDGENISGEQRDDFFMDLNPIPKPDWPVYQMITGGGSTTVLGGSKTNPKRYKLNNLSITGTEVVTFAPHAPDVESYVELWVTGDFKAAGNGTIKVEPNTNVVIFLEGNIDIKGGGTFNQNSQPGRLQILCVAPPPNETRNMSISGNGVIVAAIYGPQHDVVFGATGSEGTMWGAIVGRSIEMGGKTVIHYDEALAESGYVVDYKVKSWFEDTK